MLNPLEIHKKEFRRNFRGYNEEEVDAFLDLILKDYEILYKDNQLFQERLEESEGSVARYRDLEEVIKKTLIMAQKNAEDLRQNAEKESAMLIEEARHRADEVIQDAKRQANEVIQDAERRVEQIILDAEHKTEARVNEADSQVKAAMTEFQELHKQTMAFKARFRSLLEAHLKMLEDESKEWVKEKEVVE